MVHHYYCRLCIIWPCFQPRVTQHCSGLWISELFQLSDSSERWYTILIAGYVRGIVSAVSHYYSVCLSVVFQLCDRALKVICEDETLPGVGTTVEENQNVQK